MPIQQPDPTRGPRHHHAEAVVLDFMHPARTAGWAIGRGWQAGLDKAGPVGMRRHVKSKYLTPRERNKVGNSRNALGQGEWGEDAPASLCNKYVFCWDFNGATAGTNVLF